MNVTYNSKIDFVAAMIPMAMSWEIILDYLGGLSVITGVLTKEKQEGQRERCGHRSRGRSDTGLGTKTMWWPLEAGKRQEMDFLPKRLQKKLQALPIALFESKENDFGLQTFSTVR